MGRTELSLRVDLLCVWLAAWLLPEDVCCVPGRVWAGLCPGRALRPAARMVSCARSSRPRRRNPSPHGASEHLKSSLSRVSGRWRGADDEEAFCSIGRPPLNLAPLRVHSPPLPAVGSTAHCCNCMRADGAPRGQACCSSREGPARKLAEAVLRSSSHALRHALAPLLTALSTPSSCAKVPPLLNSLQRWSATRAKPFCPLAGLRPSHAQSRADPAPAEAD